MSDFYVRININDWHKALLRIERKNSGFLTNFHPQTVSAITNKKDLEHLLEN